MAKITNAFDSYSAVGNREDLTDDIFMISPHDTPYISMTGKTKSRATKHEWQTDTLAAADNTNAHLEGDETIRVASVPTVREENICQISKKNATISGTQEAVTKAGRKSEMAREIRKRKMELRLDMEAIITGNQAKTSGNATTARKLRSLEAWLSTNADRGATGVNPTSTVAAVDGTQRAFTEALLKPVIQQVYKAGGKPSVIMVGPHNKQVASDFLGRTQARVAIGENKIQSAASLYASDFGDLKIMPNRVQRERTVFILEPDKAKIAFLRKMKHKKLGTIGDGETREIVTEFTLEMCNEAAHGVIADVDTA